MEIDLFKYWAVKPFAFLGVTHSFLDVNLDVILYTWVGMILLFGFLFFAKWCMKRDDLSLYAIVLEQAVEFFIDLCKESLGSFVYKHFAFVFSIFSFTLCCNMVGLLPFIDESSKDLNTTLAIGFSSFLYVQSQHIMKTGFIGYLKSYVEPLPFMVPLEIVGKVASIVSMSFRLFGNILGGSIVFFLMVQVIGIYKKIFIIGSVVTLIVYAILENRLNSTSQTSLIKRLFYSLFVVIFFLAGAQMFFGIFESAIQAFVLSMLTLTYLSIAISDEESVEMRGQS